MIGIDLIKTSRMQKMMERFGDKALRKFLCSEEILIVKNYRTAAGFWAVKEACSKALGVGIGKEFSFDDIVISKTKKGAPQIVLSTRVRDSFLIDESSVSITHDGEYAIAVVVLSTTTNKV